MLGNFSAWVARNPNYHWWAYGALFVGLFLTVMDQSGTNIALPRIADHFQADIPTVQWVSLGYTLATSAFLMPMGRLADILGRKEVYIAGFAVYVCAAAVGGISPVLLMVIGGKLLQGVGSAAIQANSMAMVADIFPPQQRGRALGLYMTIIGTGAISGPIVGGLLVAWLGWRAVFFATIPVGVIAAILALLIFNMPRPVRSQGGVSSERFDWLGASLSSGGLVTFLLSMTNAYRFGWGSAPIVLGLAASAVFVIVFIWWEMRAPNAMLDLSLFRSRAFSMGVSARFLSFLGGTTVFFMMPFYLIEVLQYSSSKAGLMLVPGSVGMALSSPLVGRLSDKIGTRYLTMLGMTFSAAAMFLFSRLDLDSPAYLVAIGMALSGVGMGTFSSPNTSAIMGAADRQKYGIVSAFLNTTRTTANVSGVALATTIVTFAMASYGYEPSLSAISQDAGEGVYNAFVAGISRSFLVSTGLACVAMIISFFRSEAPPTREPAPAQPVAASAGDD